MSSEGLEATEQELHDVMDNDEMSEEDDESALVL